MSTMTLNCLKTQSNYKISEQNKTGVNLKSKRTYGVIQDNFQETHKEKDQDT